MTTNLPALLTNAQAASYLGRSPQTLRKWHCLDCAPLGIRPLVIQGRLAWQLADLQAVVSEAQARCLTRRDKTSVKESCHDAH